MSGRLRAFAVALVLSISAVAPIQTSIASASSTSALATGRETNTAHPNGATSETSPRVPNLSSLTASALDQNQRFVSMAYLDLVGTAVDAGSLDNWTAMLNEHTRQEIAQAIDTSQASYAALVASFFRRFLQRSVDSQSLNTFVSALQGGATDEQVIVDIVSAPEYFQTRAGNDNSRFVFAAYVDLLGRIPSSSDLATWTSCLGGRSCTRAQLAQTVVGSTEYLLDLCTGLFARYLHRSPSSIDRNNCVSALQGGTTDEQYIAVLVGSAEYLNNRVPSSGIPMVEGPFTGVVASFTDADENPVASDFTATITWGDGHTSSGTVTAATIAGTFDVTATNTYTEEGSYSVTVQISDTDTDQASVSTSAVVADAPLALTAVTLSPAQGTTFTVVVGSVGDAGLEGVAAYSATINWGDGSAPTTSVVTASGSALSVSGTHVYGQTGQYMVSLTFTDEGGSSTSGVTTANVTLYTPIARGWNLIDEPLQDPTIFSVETLLNDMNDPTQLGSGAIIAAATYSNGRFNVFVPGYSQTPVIGTTQGILVLSTHSGNWTPGGAAYQQGQLINLTPGWNLVAAPFPYTGMDASAIAAQLGTSCGLTQIAAYVSQGTPGYKTYVVGGSSPDFHIGPQAGMWLACASTGSWTPQ